MTSSSREFAELEALLDEKGVDEELREKIFEFLQQKESVVVDEGCGELNETLIKLQMMTEKNWKNRASLAAFLISNSL